MLVNLNSKYKYAYYFMGNTLIFQFFIYKRFKSPVFSVHTDCATFLKLKNVGKIKKNVITRFYRKLKTFINVYYKYVFEAKAGHVKL